VSIPRPARAHRGAIGGNDRILPGVFAQSRLSQRIGGIDLQRALEAGVAAFGFGSLTSSRAMTVGYEDCNALVETTSGRYFLKLFHEEKGETGCRRHLRVLRDAIFAGMQHPTVYPCMPQFGVDGEPWLAALVFDDVVVFACAMAVIDGPSMYDDRRPLNDSELRSLTDQVAAMHMVRPTPAAQPDSWSCMALPSGFANYAGNLGSDRERVGQAAAAFGAMNFQGFEWRMVHADLVPTNLMRDGLGGVHIIDFGRADVLPRIVDLAMLMAQTLVDPDTRTPDVVRIAQLLRGYHSACPLNDAERTALPVFSAAVSAMYVIGALRAQADGDTSAENLYWLERSRCSLAATLAAWPPGSDALTML
jgi:Ser/Thr protein kinase RdoA (MazF antagonist)